MKTIRIIIILLIGLSAVFAQNGDKSILTDEEINDLTSKLSLKLLLNDTQTSSVKNLLNTYRTELEKINSNTGVSSYKNQQDLESSINSQIETLLDSKQKMKYDVIQDDWWSSIIEDENN